MITELHGKNLPPNKALAPENKIKGGTCTNKISPPIK
jgi:hypothetical protein